MQCSEIRDMLSSYIDDVLDPTDRAKIEGHISSCGACRQELVNLKETIRIVSSLGELLPPEGFREQLMSRLKQEPVTAKLESVNKQIPGKLGKFTGWFSGTRKYAAAAVIIIGLGVGMGIYQLNQTGLHSYGKKEAPVEPEIAAKYESSQVLREDIAAEKQKNMMVGFADSLQYKTEASSKTGVMEQQRQNQPAKKIIKEASLNMEVGNYKNFGSKLTVLTEQYGGYIENSAENLEGPVTANFIIRVPNSQFVELLDALEKLGKVNGKNVTGRDVTSEFIDTQSRLRNLQTQETRLLNLMEKTSSLSDIVTLENELARIRGDIENLQGRLKELDDTVVYSTIRLDVTETVKVKVTPPQGVFGKAVENFMESLAALMNFLGNILKLTGWLLPWVLVIGGTGGLLVYFRQVRKKKDE